MIASLKKKYFSFFIFLSFQFIFSQHFNVSINETGESTLFIFQDSITSLEVGDEVGLFDDNAIIDSDGNTELYRRVLSSTYFPLYEDEFREIIISNYPDDTNPGIEGDVNSDDIVNILDVFQVFTPFTD